jgi:glyoxylase I family protein
MVAVKGVWAVVIFAREPGKLSRWYAAHLGVVTEPDASDGNYYGAIGDGGAAPPVRFGIYPRVRGGGRSSPSIMINYKVADLEDFRRHLASRGVEIEQELEAHGARFLYLRDPEGNRIELWESR